MVWFFSLFLINWFEGFDFAQRKRAMWYGCFDFARRKRAMWYGFFWGKCKIWIKLQKSRAPIQGPRWQNLCPRWCVGWPPHEKDQGKNKMTIIIWIFLFCYYYFFNAMCNFPKRKETLIVINFNCNYILCP